MNTYTEGAPVRSPSPPAERMRQYRRRRRRRLRPFKVELAVADIDALVRLGYLGSADRENVRAIEQAATVFISDELMTS